MKRIFRLVYKKILGTLVFTDTISFNNFVSTHESGKRFNKVEIHEHEIILIIEIASVRQNLKI